MLGRFGCKRKLENLEKTDPQSSPKPSALPENACELVHSPQHESKLSHMHRRCGLMRFEAYVSVRSVMGWRILGAVVVYHCHVDTASSILLVFFLMFVSPSLTRSHESYRLLRSSFEWQRDSQEGETDRCFPGRILWSVAEIHVLHFKQSTR